jgi:hypothetical protein
MDVPSALLVGGFQGWYGLCRFLSGALLSELIDSLINFLTRRGPNSSEFRIAQGDTREQKLVSSRALSPWQVNFFPSSNGTYWLTLALISFLNQSCGQGNARTDLPGPNP